MGSYNGKTKRLELVIAQIITSCHFIY